MTKSTNYHLTKPPTVKAQMLIRKPASEVFEAFVNPEVTTRFWFTKSSGRLETGADIQWEWAMYDLSETITVKKVEQNRRIVIEWGSIEGKPTIAEWRFFPWKDNTTFVTITETGFGGNGDQVVAHAIDSMGGFNLVLAGAKALLEHDIVLAVTADYSPKGVEKLMPMPSGREPNKNTG
jgi:uncharacterized protein YndB with AHSA1/START domain